MSEATSPRSHDILTVALVSVAHFFSHFYILVVPSLLPLIKEDLGAESAFVLFGLIMTAYAGMSAAGQYPAGAIMDCYGARLFVILGTFGVSLAIFSMGFADSVVMLIVLAAVAGLCDSQYHPSDYTIMTARVRGPWRGKAYAIHTSAGFLGFAATPTVVSFLAPIYDWREIMQMLGGAGMACAVLLVVFARFLNDHPEKRVEAKAEATKAGGSSFLFTLPILLMFGFYVATAFAGNGIQAFGIPAMIEMFEIDLVAANQTLAVYLWGITIGVLAGGLVTTWLKRFDAVAAIGYSLSAAALILIGMQVLPISGLVIGLAFVGFMVGAVMPSRDIMVASIAPAGATGKAFGFVSTGFAVGGFFGPVIYGSIMDQGAPAWLFFTSATMMLVTLAFAVAAGWATRSRDDQESEQQSAEQPAE